MSSSSAPSSSALAGTSQPKELTATQRRNARKRRSKKQKNNDKSSSSTQDPSTLYSANPTAAPIIKRARRFFADQNISFPVYNHSPPNGWRTIAKLAARSNTDSDGWQLGLFAPHSHTLLPDSALSTSHHPAINDAIRCIQSLSTSGSRVSAYNETTGEGCLRYIMFSVETSSRRVQVTFVHTATTSQKELSLLHSFLQQLVKKKKQTWHSLWLHSNTQDRHANAIVDTSSQGAWECVYSAQQEQIPVCERLFQKDNDKCPSVPLYFPPMSFDKPTWPRLLILSRTFESI